MKAEIIQSLLDWNPWLNSSFPLNLLGFKRDYDLLPYLQVPEIKIIGGARRVGKSTLMYDVIHQVYKENGKLLYINFEDEILRKYPLSEIVYAYSEKESIDFLFIDEIQNCSDWVQFVRKVYDRRELKQIWLSGSNAALIKKEYATLLTGRNLPIHIFTLSLTEFLTFKSFSLNKQGLSKRDQIELLGLFSEYMDYGAFPAVVTRDVLKKELLIAYFEDFIYKDIVARHNVNANKLKDLAIYLATNSCKIFSYRTIASIINIHLNTVMDYLNYLKEAFLFEELYKFDFSLQKQYSNDKKIYCLDFGLAAAVSFRFSEDKGRILENVVFCELKKRNCEIYFHKHKLECDFLIKEDLKIVLAIQVCMTLENDITKKRELNGLLEALEIYNLEKGVILTFEEEGVEYIIQDSKKYTIMIQPVWKWLIEK